MILRLRLLCVFAAAAALAAAGCDKTQSLLNDAKQRADQFGTGTAEATVDPEAAPDDLNGALPELPTNINPMDVQGATPAVVDDAAIIAQWNATKSHDRTDAAIRKLLQASPEALKDITAIDLKSAGPMLTVAGFQMLKDLPLVKSLDCSMHQLSADKVEAICSLQQLEDLGMRASGLDDTMLAPLSKLATLRVLNVTNNPGVSDAGLKSINRLVELQSLDIELTRVAGSCLLKANFLGGLKRLNADGSAFSDGFAALKSTPNLEFLGVADTGCTDQHMKFVGGLDNLREIHLHGNGGVSDVGFSQLKGNGNFEVIDIRATNVSGASLRFLLKAKNLSVLRTEESKVDGATLAALRKEHPNAMIK